MRSIWKGSISFGLVNIPVQMYTASHDKEISFVLLHKKDLSQIRYARICKADGKEVPWEEIVKGYEYEKGEFVVMKDEDFEKASAQKTKTIEMIHFVDEQEIDSVYYVRPYFLEPTKQAEKAYGLLRDALKKSKKVGIARYVLRNREHLAVIKIHDEMLILNELRYAGELVSAGDLHIPATQKGNAKELQMAMQLIDQLSTSFNPKKYKDTYVDEMKQIIKKKAKGKLIHPKADQTPRVSKVHDMMSLLKQSLEKKPKKRSRKSA